MKWLLLFLSGLMLCGCASRAGRESDWRDRAVQKHRWGYYTGTVETRWERDGRTMTLLTELRYTDPDGVVWIAPAGSQVDGASIPRSLWSIMGGPFEGIYRNASVLHDVAYTNQNRPWRDVDRMFYHAMRCSGVSAAKAKTMYYAIYRYGRHWKNPIKRALPAPPEVTRTRLPEEETRRTAVDPAEVDAIQRWIQSADPSLEQIEARAVGSDGSVRSDR